MALPPHSSSASTQAPVTDEVGGPPDHDLEASSTTAASSPLVSQSALLIGFLIALAGVGLFSAKPIVVKLMYAEEVGSEVTLALRMAMSAPLYIAIGLFGVWRSGAPGLTVNRTLAIIGVGLLGYYVASYLDLLGLEYIPAQIERMVIFTYPVFVALIGFILFREKLSLWGWLALALAYLGIASALLGDVQLSGSIDLRGVALCLASAICFAGYIVLSKRLIQAVGAQLFTSIAMTAASVGILVQILVTDHIGDLAVSETVLGLGVINAVFCTVLPSYLASMAIGRLGGQTFSVIGSAGPVITSVLAVGILGEVFGWFHALGLALVISGIVILQRSQTKAA